MFRNHLAPISGTIEESDPTPLAAALREIAEETTLTVPRNLTFLRHGPRYTFTDRTRSVNREWTIYPFAFALRDPASENEAKIKIDWEHSSWNWFSPDDVHDVPSFGGVPHLADSLRRVWFEKELGNGPGRVLREGLEELRGDYESGARVLAGKALGILRGVVQSLDVPSSPSSSSLSSCGHEPAAPGEGEREEGGIQKWWWQIRLAAWHIWKNGRESMSAPILAALLGVLGDKRIQQQLQGQQQLVKPETENKYGEEFKHVVLETVTAAIQARDQTTGEIAEALQAYLAREFPYPSSPNSDSENENPLAILTLSQSSTISAGLAHMAKTRPLDVRVLESRPLFEGVAMAGSLINSLGPDSLTKVRLYTDAAAAVASAGVDVVLLGADRIASSGAASNKTGSLPAVLSARHVAQQDGKSIKVVVVGDSEKIAPPGRAEDHVVEENDSALVTKTWLANDNKDAVKTSAATLTSPDLTQKKIHVEVSNIFFEWVPPDLIDTYITEFGEQSRDDISRKSRQLGQEFDAILGSV